MKKVLHYLKKYCYQIILVVIVGLIFITNLQGNTSLIGWDNFNSELAPGMAVKQAFNAGWSSFRSFGLVAGMGYATDSIHAVCVWLLSFIMPLHAIRYFFHSLVLLIGGLGVFSLFSFMNITPFFSFLGALYYILNFGTVQIFGLPYEPFSLFFCFLPWALFTWFQALRTINKKTLLWFFIANFLLSGAFYVQTLFVVYALLLGVLHIIFLIEQRNAFFLTIKRVFLLGTIMLGINAYWLMTQAYFLTTSVGVVQTAKQVILGWRMPFYENKVHSTFFDFFTQHGYYADFQGADGKYLFSHWLTYLSQPHIVLLQIFVVGIVLIGIFDGKNRYKKYFLPLLLFHAIALLMDIPILKEINTFFRQFTIIDQIMRSPFSKFVMSLSLIVGYFFAIGSESLISHVRNIKWKLVSSAVIVFSIICIGFPAISGNFFVPTMKVAVPKEYCQLFDFFKKQDKNKRVVTLPELNVWGWYTYKWGYQGSGFLWHGIEQPIVSRSYDVWSTTSENYYWEIGSALAKKDKELLFSVWDKYHISYVVIDQSQTGLSPKAIYSQLAYFAEIAQTDTRLQSVFKTKNIEVYEIRNVANNVIETAEYVPNIGPQVHSLFYDRAYIDQGTYVTTTKSSFGTYYPFLDLQSYTDDKKKNWKIEEKNGYFELSSILPSSVDLGQITIATQESFLIETQTGYKTINMPIQSTIDNEKLIVRFPMIKIDPINFTDVQSCDLQKRVNNSDIEVSLQKDKSKEITVQGGDKACFGYHYDTLFEQYAYVLKINSENVQGVPLSFYASSFTARNTYLQYQLNTNGEKLFLLPSASPDGIGVSINFQSPSFINTPSKNIVKETSMYLFPEKAILQTGFIKSHTSLYPLNDFIKKNDWLYVINANNIQKNVLFFEAYDEGWKAYELKAQSSKLNWLQTNFPFFFGSEIKEHVLVNNWANGWVLDSSKLKAKSSKIVIIFWPQYLEFIGFALLVMCVIVIIFWPARHPLSRSGD